jgi:acyl-CoA synthetase (AMP-forming)/AMP-acid ligase II/acyl carrier protein
MTRPDTVVDSLRAWTAEAPDRAAVGTITYGELGRLVSERAGALAHLPSGSVVAVALDDPVEQAVWLVSVMAAGRTVLSLDVQYPAARRQDLAARADAALIVTDPHLVGEPIELRAVSDQPAFICFTSGSSGAPKGVVVSHAALSATVAGFAGHLGGTPRTHLLATSWAFDVAMLDLWLALTTGGTLMLPERDQLLGGALPELLAAFDRPVLQAVPSLLSGLTDAEIDRLPGGATIVLGGETASADLLTRLAQQVDLRVAYGVTEAAVCSTAGRVTPGDAPSGIGAPLPGVRVAVVGAHGRGASEGELWLSGSALALGYLNDPVATDATFCADPDGTRWYRTGDQVRWQDDGTLAFLGRVDDQLTVRGHRVEPAEVEHVLAAQPGVRQVAVALRPDPTGAPCLVGYVVGDADLASLRSAAAEQLPSWMVPDHLVALDRLPLNANGKIVRSDLPAPQWPTSQRTDAATGVHDTVDQLWRDLLGDTGDGDFIASGGHSLKAVQMSVELRDRLGVSVPVSKVLGAASAADLSELVRTSASAPEDGVAERVGLSALQREMWLYQELAGDAGLYNLVVSVTLRGQLEVPALERALHDVERHQPALRMAYRFDGNDVVAQEVAAGPPRLQVRRMTENAVADVGAKAIDLTTGRLWDYQLLREADQHVLLLTFHHIAVDGVSVEALLHEVAARYRVHTGTGPPVEAKAHKETHRLDTVENDLAVWRRMLADPPAPVRLPGQEISTTTGELSGSAIGIELAGIDAGDLRGRAGARGATLQSAVLSCVVRALAELSGQWDVLLGIPVSRRGIDVPTDAIGQYSSGLPMRFVLTDRTAIGCLDVVADRIRLVLDHPRVDPGAVLEEIRAQGGDPAFQVAFGWDEETAPLELPGLEVKHRLEFSGWAEWGLTVELAVRDHAIEGRLFGRTKALAAVNLAEFSEVITECARDLINELRGDLHDRD